MSEVTDAEFKNAVRDCWMNVSLREMADAVSVSHPTIVRWLTGRNSPHQALRPYVLKTFKELSNARRTN